MADHDYTRAILEFQNAVKVKSDDPEAYYQLALAQLAAGQTVPAAINLRKVTTLNPNHAAAQMKVAEILTADPEIAALKEAERRIRIALDQSPNNPDALNILATAEWKLGKREEAEDLLNQTFSRSPANLQVSVNLAKVKLSHRDTAGAEKILQTAVAADPHSADLALALGSFYATIDQPSKAEQQFRRALEIEPKRGTALVALAGLKMRANQTKEAGLLYQQASALADPEFKPLHATFLFQTGKRDAAIAEFEKLVKQYPADRSIRTRLVAVYETANRTPEAEKILADALQKNPKDTDALLQRSELEVHSGHYVVAQSDLEKILKFYPDSAVAHYLMGRICQRRGATLQQRQEWSDAVRLDPKFLVARSQLAQLLISTNAAQAALDLLNETPEEQKNLPGVLFQKNWALLALGRQAEARKGIDRALAAGRTPEVLLQDATLRVTQQDIPGARKSLEEALKQNPEDTDALHLLVQTYDVQKQPGMAVQKVREYVEKEPNSAALRQFFGELLAKTGDEAGARKALMAAKATAPGSFEADLWLAQLDLSAGKLDDARSRLSTLIAANPEDVTMRLLLGTVEERAGNLAAAMEQYAKAVELNDQNVTALNNLAFLLADSAQRQDEALRWAQKAAEMAPDSPAVDDTLGWVFYKKGLYASAVPYLEKAVSKEPTGRRKCHLALAYLKSGNRERGRELLATAIKASPELMREPFLQEFLAGSQQ